MPGSTARGLPYALPTDPLVQWPATSQQLAEAVDGLDGQLGTFRVRIVKIGQLTLDGGSRARLDIAYLQYAQIDFISVIGADHDSTYLCSLTNPSPAATPEVVIVKDGQAAANQTVGPLVFLIVGSL